MDAAGIKSNFASAFDPAAIHPGRRQIQPASPTATIDQSADQASSQQRDMDRCRQQSRDGLRSGKSFDRPASSDQRCRRQQSE